MSGPSRGSTIATAKTKGDTHSVTAREAADATKVRQETTDPAVSGAETGHPTLRRSHADQHAPEAVARSKRLGACHAPIPRRSTGSPPRRHRAVFLVASGTRQLRQTHRRRPQATRPRPPVEPRLPASSAQGRESAWPFEPRRGDAGRRARRWVTYAASSLWIVMSAVCHASVRRWGQYFRSQQAAVTARP